MDKLNDLSGIDGVRMALFNKGLDILIYKDGSGCIINSGMSGKDINIVGSNIEFEFQNLIQLDRWIEQNIR